MVLACDFANGVVLNLFFFAMEAPWHGASVFQDSVKNMAPCWRMKSPNGCCDFLATLCRRLPPPEHSSAAIAASGHRHRSHSRRRRRYHRHRAVGRRRRRRCPRVAAAAAPASSAAAFIGVVLN